MHLYNDLIFFPSSYTGSYKSKNQKIDIINPTQLQTPSPEPTPEPISPPTPEPVREPTPLPVAQPEPVSIPEPVPKPEVVVLKPKTSTGPVIREYTPFNPEPFVLYDKDRNPVQKLVTGVPVAPQTADIVPVAMDTTDGARAPITTKVVTVETTEVRKQSRKESIEITKVSVVLTIWFLFVKG